jgi:hypothetical protein
VRTLAAAGPDRAGGAPRAVRAGRPRGGSGAWRGADERRWGGPAPPAGRARRMTRAEALLAGWLRAGRSAVTAIPRPRSQTRPSKGLSRLLIQTRRRPYSRSGPATPSRGAAERQPAPRTHRDPPLQRLARQTCSAACLSRSRSWTRRCSRSGSDNLRSLAIIPLPFSDPPHGSHRRLPARTPEACHAQGRPARADPTSSRLSADDAVAGFTLKAQAPTRCFQHSQSPPVGLAEPVRPYTDLSGHFIGRVLRDTTLRCRLEARRGLASAWVRLTRRPGAVRAHARRRR